MPTSKEITGGPAYGRSREDRHAAELAVIRHLEDDDHGHRSIALIRKLSKQVWRSIKNKPHKNPKMQSRHRSMVREVLATCDEVEASWATESVTSAT